MLDLLKSPGGPRAQAAPIGDEDGPKVADPDGLIDAAQFGTALSAAPLRS